MFCLARLCYLQVGTKGLKSNPATSKWKELMGVWSMRSSRSYTCTKGLSILQAMIHHSPNNLRLYNHIHQNHLYNRLKNCSMIWSSLIHTSSIEYDNSKEVEKNNKKEHGSVLMQVLGKKDEPKQLTVGAKVVQAGRDFTYLIAILVGFGLVGFLFYSVGSEFFSSNSPSSVFTQALKRVRADERIKEILGEPITGHGEESGRGRRRHLNHLEYVVDGRTYMRMQFYVSGSRRKGKAHIDLKKNDSGKYELRFLFVELIGYPSGTIILEDNR